MRCALWIFSYGELGPQQIEELLGHAPFCSLPASVPNSKVAFKGKSRKWTGAVASLERSKGNWVYGSALLISEDELPIFDKYFHFQKQVLVPILIDATKDKIKAIAYICDKEASYGEPSDDYSKAMLKHLKFFWGQRENESSVTLASFGINTTPPVEKKMPKELRKEPVSKEKTNEAVKNILSDLEDAGLKKTRRRTKI